MAIYDYLKPNKKNPLMKEEVNYFFHSDWGKWIFQILDIEPGLFYKKLPEIELPRKRRYLCL